MHSINLWNLAMSATSKSRLSFALKQKYSQKDFFFTRPPLKGWIICENAHMRGRRVKYAVSLRRRLRETEGEAVLRSNPNVYREQTSWHKVSHAKKCSILRCPMQPYRNDRFAQTCELDITAAYSWCDRKTYTLGWEPHAHKQECIFEFTIM